MRIDLHVHASERSGCSVATEEELIWAAMEAGLDALAFTDHHKLVPPEHLVELNEKYSPFRVFGGIEITTYESEDVLVFGVQTPILEQGQWSYAALREFVLRHMGFMAIAHPFRYRDELGVDVENYPPDAIEKRSANISPSQEVMIRELIERVGCHALHSSDSHTTDCIGLYHIAVRGEPQDDVELVQFLRAGKYTLEELEGEKFEIVDEEGNPEGMATRRECHSNPDLIHQVVHVIVTDSEGRMFLQKRAHNKDIQPGRWDTSVGGHMKPGEKPLDAAMRETVEELGFKPKELKFLYKYLWRSDVESELVRTYHVVSDGPFNLQTDEIDEGRFWDFSLIEANLGYGVLTPNFEAEFQRFAAYQKSNS